MSKDLDEVSRDELNLETAKISWQELEKFFASGSVIQVAEGCDLIEVAYQMAFDNKDQFAEWIAAGTVAVLSDAIAQQWNETNQAVWAVVVKPWILVQAVAEKDPQ